MPATRKIAKDGFTDWIQQNKPKGKASLEEWVNKYIIYKSVKELKCSKT